ncbi:hypothetical protein CGLO_14221 [Colletotrichum gloeosporioides Cg-14]|uniref:Uncharacterized protein n=1 Tax=Colletotrichum gloeosporioides (strain Cg-14) TaxID=1237896 RepID=T0L559_COLGC|nr:hypothetical protein CGLO_14221 [Colletotrichum gloeosporioides Cg-14]
MATENTNTSRAATTSSDSSTGPPTTIYAESSFFKGHPGATLPTPAEIRAINVATGDPCTDEFDSPPPVIVRDLGLFIKYGRFVTIVEASTHIMVREKLQGEVAVPEVFGWAEDGRQVKYTCPWLREILWRKDGVRWSKKHDWLSVRS